MLLCKGQVSPSALICYSYMHALGAGQVHAAVRKCHHIVFADDRPEGLYGLYSLSQSSVAWLYVHTFKNGVSAVINRIDCWVAV